MNTTLQAAIAGDKQSFWKLYEVWFDEVWAYVYSRLGDREEAKDLVSEAFITLYKHITNISHPKAVKSYLFRIVKSDMSKRFAKKEPIAYSEEWIDVAVVEEEPSESNNNTKKINVEKMLKELPDSYQEVLRLRFLSGLKIREVAEVMGKTEQNVKVLQHRAIKKAREITKGVLSSAPQVGMA